MIHKVEDATSCVFTPYLDLVTLENFLQFTLLATYQNICSIDFEDVGSPHLNL